MNIAFRSFVLFLTATLDDDIKNFEAEQGVLATDQLQSSDEYPQNPSGHSHKHGMGVISSNLGVTDARRCRESPRWSVDKSVGFKLL
ncbi:hypothetical protein TNCV_540581 [Trichonephila clavipes]|nr:hypothetical protein TNCV_540581 [Trichonephila clavipes]